MQVITTKFLPWTNTKPSRIKATTGNGLHSLSLGSNSTPYSSDSIQAHQHVASHLMNKMGWKGELIGGGTKSGFVFVIVPEKVLQK